LGRLADPDVQLNLPEAAPGDDRTLIDRFASAIIRPPEQGREAMHPAAKYNGIRRIIFSAVHKHGFDEAQKWLESTYRPELDSNHYRGLKAELAFYRKYQRELQLTVAGDMGEHADFSGLYQGQVCRFDVTTNLAYKDFATFEPFMGEGPRYKIALLDQSDFEVIDVLDLAFKLCTDCGGHLIPCVAMLAQNYNSRGEAQWSNDQILMDVCTGCHQYFERNRFTTTGMFSPQEIFDSRDDRNDSAPAITARREHMLNAYRYFRPAADANLMALAEHSYKVTERDGGGYWAFRMVFKNKAIAAELPDEIECPHEV
jgi:hypothetical protein